MAEDYDNEKIIAWGKKNLTSIKNTIDALGIKHSPRSPNPISLKNNVFLKIRKNRDGMVDKVSYGMPRSAVFEHKGVSRGHPISNPRKAKHWFDIPTDINLPDLQNIVAENDVTYVINNLQIK